MDESVTDLFSQRMGQDISKPLEDALAALSDTSREEHLACLNNVFYMGQTDFRKSARCQVQNYILLAASAILMSSMALKCKLRSDISSHFQNAYPIYSPFRVAAVP